MMAVVSCLFISFHTAVLLPKEENKSGNLLLKLGSRVGKSMPRTIGFGLAWCFGYSLGRYPEVQVINSKVLFMWAAQEFQELLRTASLDGVQKSIHLPLSPPSLDFDDFLAHCFSDNLASPFCRGGRHVRQKTSGVAFGKSEKVC